MGIQFDWRLKNERLSISIVPLKVRPREKAASAAATTRVWAGSKRPRWYTRRVIGSARTALTMLAGTSRNAICRRPRPTVCRKPARSFRAARRASEGNSTVAIATENIPCGSM